MTMMLLEFQSTNLFVRRLSEYFKIFFSTQFVDLFTVQTKRTNMPGKRTASYMNLAKYLNDPNLIFYVKPLRDNLTKRKRSYLQM